MSDVIEGTPELRAFLENDAASKADHARAWQLGAWSTHGQTHCEDEEEARYQQMIAAREYERARKEADKWIAADLRLRGYMGLRRRYNECVFGIAGLHAGVMHLVKACR